MTSATPASWATDGRSPRRIAPSAIVVTGWIISSTDVITAGSLGSEAWIRR